MQTGIKSGSALFPCPAPAHPGTAKKRIAKTRITKTRITKKSISLLHRYSRIDSIFLLQKSYRHTFPVSIWNMEMNNGWHPEHGNEKYQRKNKKAVTKKAQPRQKRNGAALFVLLWIRFFRDDRTYLQANTMKSRIQARNRHRVSLSSSLAGSGWPICDHNS